MTGCDGGRAGAGLCSFTSLRGSDRPSVMHARGAEPRASGHFRLCPTATRSHAGRRMLAQRATASGGLRRRRRRALAGTGIRLQAPTDGSAVVGGSGRSSSRAARRAACRPGGLPVSPIRPDLPAAPSRVADGRTRGSVRSRSARPPGARRRCATRSRSVCRTARSRARRSQGSAGRGGRCAVPSGTDRAHLHYPRNCRR